MDEGSEDGERREASRAPIELKVEYKKLNTFFADYTRNISKGGTFIKWVVREGQPIPPEAGSEHEPGMGIRFLYESEEERRAIESVVERLMIDSLGQLIYSKLMSADRGRDRGALR